MTAPEPLSRLGLYGNRDAFAERLAEGYTTVAFGSGPWIERDTDKIVGNLPGDVADRVVGVFAFYHPEGRVATLESRKVRDCGQTTRRVKALRVFGGVRTFEEMVDAGNVTIDEPVDLAELVGNWEV